MSYSYTFIDKDIHDTNGVDDQVYISLEGVVTYLNDKEPFQNNEINISMGKFISHIDEVSCITIDLNWISEKTIELLDQNGIEQLLLFLSIIPEYITISILQPSIDTVSVTDIYNELISFNKNNISTLNNIHNFFLERNINVVLYGSCDSRDIIRIHEDVNRVGQFNVNYYIAGNSIAALFDEPVNINEDTVRLDSKFLEMCVKSDLKKDAFSNIAKNLDDKKILIIDFMDERFSLLEQNGRKYTKSWNLQKTEHFENLKDSNMLAFDSDEKLNLTLSNIDVFFKAIKNIIPLDNVFINETIMCFYYFDGIDSFLPFDEKRYSINRYNVFARKVIDYIKNNFEQVNILGTPEYMNFGDGTHLWGAHPYHYNKLFYLSRARKIIEIMVKKGIK